MCEGWGGCISVLPVPIAVVIIGLVVQQRRDIEVTEQDLGIKTRERAVVVMMLNKMIEHPEAQIGTVKTASAASARNDS